MLTDALDRLANDKTRSHKVTTNLLKESDRGCVIFLAAQLDEALKELLLAFLRRDEKGTKSVVGPLFSGYAPLATFSARIKLAYAIRLINQNVLEKLVTIRRLRNVFAHESGPIDLGDPRCRDLVVRLVGNRSAESIECEQIERRYFGNQLLTKDQIIDRLAFCIETSELMGRLHGKTEILKAYGDDIGLALNLVNDLNMPPYDEG